LRERLLTAQNFRGALLTVVSNTDGPCGLIGCFFTGQRQLFDTDLRPLFTSKEERRGIRRASGLD